MENICRFVQEEKAPDTLHILRFVQETQKSSAPVIPTTYKLCYVNRGSGQIQCLNVTYPVKMGDIFLLLPSVPYTVSGDGEFSYLYISFIGIRANMLIDWLHITYRHFVFPGYSGLGQFWEEGLCCRENQLEMTGEAILLYTLAKLDTGGELGTVPRKSMTLLAVKQYIDENISDPELTLETISEACAYHPKYLSGAFQKQFRCGIKTYIRFVRINRACALMQQGQTSVSDIAWQCGFRDPLYFSRVFKKYMGFTPTEQIKKCKKQ